MNRAEVWLVNFEPSAGGEIRKTRPAIIVSNDASNKVMNRVQVIPLTSKTDKLYPCEAYVTFNGEMRKAMADQIATASKDRLIKRMGRINEDDIRNVERAIAVQLGLSQ